MPYQKNKSLTRLNLRIQAQSTKAMKNSNPNFNPHVSYGFCEALNLIEDYQEAIKELTDDPTNSQVIIQTSEGKTGTGDCGYFMIRKAAFLHPTDEDYTETREYSITDDGLDAEDYWLDFDNLDDLRNIVDELIDNWQVTSIYIDSL